MKKYLTGSIAFLLAVAFSAFTSPKPLVDMYVFEFDASQSGGYSLSNVQNETNTYWKYVGKNQSLCSDDDVRACRVSVTEDFVNNPTIPTSLSGVTITATESSTGVAYVSNITSLGTNLYSNKE